jgi:hypothetical protein
MTDFSNELIHRGYKIRVASIRSDCLMEMRSMIFWRQVIQPINRKRGAEGGNEFFQR